jgi:hypothetical protein
MAIFNQIPKSELGTTWTHYGYIHGFVPVYLSELDGPSINVAVRNWCPEWLEDLGRTLWLLVDAVTSAVNPDFKCPGFRIDVGPRIPTSRT